MTEHIRIGDITPCIAYTGNGTQTAFVYPFPIFRAEDLIVHLDGVVQNGGYTVGGAGNSSGGTVTFASPPAAGRRVTLERRLGIQRQTDFQEGGALRAKALNDELDFQTAVLQQLDVQGKRALRAAVTDEAADLTLPSRAARSGKALIFDAEGGATVSADDYADQVASVTAQASAATTAAAQAAASAAGAAGSAGAAAAAATRADNSASQAQSWANRAVLAAGAAAGGGALPPTSATLSGLTLANMVDCKVYRLAGSWRRRTPLTLPETIFVTLESTASDYWLRIFDPETGAQLYHFSETSGSVYQAKALAAAENGLCHGFIPVATAQGLLIFSLRHALAGGMLTMIGPHGRGSYGTYSVPALSYNDVTHVAMGLSDSPRRDVYGDPVPTIAVGYGVGATRTCSVIKDDGSAVHISTGWPGHAGGIAIARGRLVANWQHTQTFVVLTPLSQLAGDFGATENVGYVLACLYSSYPYNGHGGGLYGMVVQDDTLVQRSTGGLTLVKTALDRTAMTAGVTNTYATGWMVGDIRGVWGAAGSTTSGAWASDWSYKNNSLTTNGTITVFQVNGGRLYAASGFSAANHFSRAYDADFDFASGQIMVAAWFKTTVTGVDQMIVSRGQTTPGGARLHLYLDTLNQVKFAVSDGTNTITAVSTDLFNDGQWHLAVGTYDYATDVVSIFVDGVLQGSAVYDIGSMVNANALLYVGLHTDGGTIPFGGSLTLVRISASAPSPAQIRWMFETERRLIDGAECLLAGAANTVNSVSIDPKSGRVYAAQTDCMNVFDGLVRVSSTNAAAGLATTSANVSDVAVLDGYLIAKTAGEVAVHAPALDLRDVVERGVEQPMGGAGLGEAKALAFVASTGAIAHSHNVKSVTKTATGHYRIDYARRFKARFGVFATCYGSGGEWATVALSDLHYATIVTRNAGGLADVYFFFAAYGELEDE